MSVGVTMSELLVWNEEAATFWKGHLEANPALLEAPCTIGNTGTVQGLVRHIWGAEQRWADHLGSTQLTQWEAIPAGPLAVLYAVHEKAMATFRELLAAPEASWDTLMVMNYSWLPEEQRTLSRRKALAHVLTHSQRHWAQLATLARETGFPAKHGGDLLFSSAL